MNTVPLQTVGTARAAGELGGDSGTTSRGPLAAQQAAAALAAVLCAPLEYSSVCPSTW